MGTQKNRLNEEEIHCTLQLNGSGTFNDVGVFKKHINRPLVKACVPKINFLIS